MAVIISEIQTAGDYYRRSGETNELTAAKALEAAALACEDVQNQALFRFAQRVQRFDFLDGQSDYVISDNATNFEASIRAPDFRAVKDLRLSVEHTDDFDYVDPNAFALIYGDGRTDKVYTVEDRDGGRILRVNQADIGSSTVLHQASDHDANGTWTADATNSDALNVATDTIVYQKNSGSVKFEADVSQSANNRVTVSVSDMTAIDLTAYRQSGVIRFWVYLPDITDDTSMYVTSIELRWGSSSSAYWSLTRARPVNSAIFQDRWNLMEFAWKDAVETGTVDETAVNYILVTINYAAGQADAVGFRINDFNIYNPKEMKMVYFSNYTAKITSTLIWKPRVTATSDLILAPDQYKGVYVDAYNFYVANLVYPTDDKRIQVYERRYRGQYDARTRKWVGGSLERMIREMGERIKLPTKKLIPQIKFT